MLKWIYPGGKLTSRQFDRKHEREREKLFPLAAGLGRGDSRCTMTHIGHSRVKKVTSKVPELSSGQ